MDRKIIKAIFRGKDGSCGYQNGREYILEIRLGAVGYITISHYGGKICPYESILSFLNNWDCIRVSAEN